MVKKMRKSLVHMKATEAEKNLGVAGDVSEFAQDRKLHGRNHRRHIIL
jgi:hypothetical protein